MHQYKVELHVSFARQKTVSVMADNHAQAKFRAERQYGLVVLSTEFVK
jgi:hypothetical protein